MAGLGLITADSHRRFRWLVVLCLLGVAMWLLLSAIEDQLHRAETMAARLMLNQVRSALVVRGAEAMLARDETLEELAGMNPLPLLDTSYAPGLCGEQSGPEEGWCFDSEESWLVYGPRQPLALEGRYRNTGEPFHWQVRVDYAGTVKNGKIDDKRGIGLKLVEINRYQVRENE
ncbi:hypothetical protein SAMN05216203_3455 [Marinobacter daqiaonensis]|uniref:Type IV pilus assembly protein PilX n=1 Tax=Marinobacter daqiaonensis TaxID=650891 RepID=A0A1I6K188_9GAMM|nr:hypothetical protein [Marinobacter daqiaonensis]SFR85012.1 hypothetical protein SAMN05216203_3455 [Marinobacter daqiaonensis]